MILKAIGRFKGKNCIPRMSGDDPEVFVPIGLSLLYSPHERG